MVAFGEMNLVSLTYITRYHMGLDAQDTRHVVPTTQSRRSGKLPDEKFLNN